MAPVTTPRAGRCPPPGWHSSWCPSAPRAAGALTPHLSGPNRHQVGASSRRGPTRSSRPPSSRPPCAASPCVASRSRTAEVEVAGRPHGSGPRRGIVVKPMVEHRDRRQPRRCRARRRLPRSRSPAPRPGPQRRQGNARTSAKTWRLPGRMDRSSSRAERPTARAPLHVQLVGSPQRGDRGRPCSPRLSRILPAHECQRHVHPLPWRTPAAAVGFITAMTGFWRAVRRL
jgi:hypothetical protein